MIGEHIPGMRSKAEAEAAAVSERQAVAVSTPGKLILMGEHAVVYGRPALVAAIDLRLRARFSALPRRSRGGSPPSRPERVEIDLPGLGYRTTASWEEVLGYTRAARDGWAAYAARPDLPGFLALRGEDSKEHLIAQRIAKPEQHIHGRRLPLVFEPRLDQGRLPGFSLLNPGNANTPFLQDASVQRSEAGSGAGGGEAGEGRAAEAGQAH